MQLDPQKCVVLEVAYERIRELGDWRGALIPLWDRREMHTHHTIDYIEFTVRDMAAAKGFHGATVGFTGPSGNELAVWSPA